MLRHIILIVATILSAFSTFAAQLSDQAEIRLMTIGPTQRELYSAFGHSAFIVVDPIQKISNAYNYGIYDFEQPNFYLNFTKGRPVYKLGVYEYQRMSQFYIRENRSIVEQTLNLTPKEMQQLFDYLEENRKPENQDYVYNYVYDNCATKMRDVVEAVLGPKITFQYEYASQQLTLRELMDLYMVEQPWGDFGIDICLGVQIDKVASGSEYMFLPDYVEKAFASATITREGKEVPLVSNTREIFEPVPEPDVSAPIKPVMVTILLFLMIGLFTHRGLKYGLSYRGLDYTILAITGIIGVLLSVLWFGTDHLSKYNWNLLWAMPLNLPAIYFLLRKKIKPFVKYYFLLLGSVQVILIVFHGILPQALHIALIPLILAIAIRSFYVFFDLNRKEKGERYFYSK